MVRSCKGKNSDVDRNHLALASAPKKNLALFFLSFQQVQSNRLRGQLFLVLQFILIELALDSEALTQLRFWTYPSLNQDQTMALDNESNVVRKA